MAGVVGHREPPVLHGDRTHLAAWIVDPTIMRRAACAQHPETVRADLHLQAGGPPRDQPNRAQDEREQGQARRENDHRQQELTRQRQDDGRHSSSARENAHRGVNLASVDFGESHQPCPATVRWRILYSPLLRRRHRDGIRLTRARSLPPPYLVPACHGPPHSFPGASRVPSSPLLEKAQPSEAATRRPMHRSANPQRHSARGKPQPATCKLQPPERARTGTRARVVRSTGLWPRGLPYDLSSLNHVCQGVRKKDQARW
jgi:hypothetical protein